MARGMVALLLLALAVGPPARLEAQTPTGSVTGTVTDAESGRPLEGVLMQLVGTRRTAATNESGRYIFLNVAPGNYTITAQYLGYSEGRAEGVTIAAGGSATADIRMRQTALALDEVVVTGVSEATATVKTPFTVGRVSGENITAVPTVGSAVSAIQGKVAGVQMIRSSGLPGAGTNVLLRSPTSIQGSSSPMYVIDGVVMATEIGGTTVDLEALDIESIEVVKGAAAASLYGSRAASGVIAITTNRGRNLALDQTRITARTEFGISDNPKMISLSRSHPWLQNEQGQWVDANGNVVPRTSRVVGPRNMMDNPYRNQTFDNLGRFFQPAQFSQNNMNLSHRTESTNFMASATRFYQRGTLETNEGFTRDNFRLNLDHRLRSDFSFTVSAQHTRYDQDLIYQGSSGEGGIFWDLLMFPVDVNIDVKDAQGKYVQQPDSTVLLTNPLWYEESREFYDKRVRTIANAEARWNPFQRLTITGSVGYDRSDENTFAYTPRGTSTSLTSEQTSNGFLRKDDEIGDAFTGNLRANLTHNIGELNLRTTASALLERERNDFTRAEGSNFWVEGVPRLNVAADRTVQSELVDIRSSGYSLDQYVDFGGRYILTGLVRRDGSSLFGPDNRWHNYYRIGGTWRVAEEPWWNVDAITELGLRYSRGTAGNRPDFAWQYETWSVSNTGTVSKNTLGNRNLRPEHTTEQEMGVNIGVNNRYSLQLTYATQKTKDQIIQLALPAVYGYSSQRYNTGVMSGHSYEATLEAQLVTRPGFQWTMTAVADRSRSKIDEWNRACFISTLRNVCQGASLADMWGERHLTSLDEIRAMHPNAVDQFQVNDDGYVVWVGPGGDYRRGLSDNLWGTSDRVDGRVYNWGIPIKDLDEAGFPLLQQIGSSDLDVNLGWLNNILWRGFAIHTHMHAQVGGQVYNATKQRLYQHERSGDLDQGGKPDELKKTLDYYQAIYNAMNPTQHFVEPGSYLKLRSVSVQYRFNQAQLNRFGVGRFARGVNLGANLRNVFTITNYSGFDPEVGSVLQRRDYFNYPNTRQLTLTAEFTF